MKILAIDSSSGACSVALLDGEAVTERFSAELRDHTRRILPMVDELLAGAGLKLSDLDAFAVGRGPGSFTGIRIAISCIQGLAFACSKPVVPVSSLAALARGARRRNLAPADAVVVPALDARMQEVYCAAYDGQELSAIAADGVMAPERAAELVSRLSAEGRPVVGVGPGWNYPALSALGSDPLAGAAQVLSHVDVDIHAEDVARLAAELFQAGEHVQADALEPAYVRTEISWKKRERIRQKGD
ncbi:tRNA (adenosine(37)-N6)-threonylcarbamoyltransferase complex dimerization subunit type 1 TsaB [Biformimicrobium ophioploci]|uniref:tRNA threonylcarbamoyladenosine biosynthesis protein TsaB n=1 Tax=Biformimicrobium ophioploci TaxID=3036711 RepID=A0ABQ6LZT6_9GAMM|nr:tRNA (adenosine(37)-N6)-threonylcarbamoyltransferase complex dimerization subunit type 1 TsaB [Microbulbifer sp. NKW57]GMG87610.1 tRNA (adenosine(37)-N6)-threonylcarbamoyltransferase complex dimerization subunit type 1 TsaB [Microbulbifer sp. NKW57]